MEPWQQDVQGSVDRILGEMRERQRQLATIAFNSGLLCLDVCALAADYAGAKAFDSVEDGGRGVSDLGKTLLDPRRLRDCFFVVSESDGSVLCIAPHYSCKGRKAITCVSADAEVAHFYVEPTDVPYWTGSCIYWASACVMPMADGKRAMFVPVHPWQSSTCFDVATGLVVPTPVSELDLGHVRLVHAIDRDRLLVVAWRDRPVTRHAPRKPLSSHMHIVSWSTAHAYEWIFSGEIEDLHVVPKQSIVRIRSNPIGLYVGTNCADYHLFNGRRLTVHERSSRMF